MGLITSKRNAKLAVWRNRIRRQAREVFRQNTIRDQPVDIIVIAKHGAAKANDRELQQCLDKVFKQLENGYKPA